MSSNHDILNIGAKLRAARRKQKLSLRELASLADVSPSLLSQIENGRANPSVITLYNVSGALDVPITSFFPDQEETPLPSNNHLPLKSDKTAAEIRAHDHNEFAAITQQFDSPVLSRDSRMAIELMGGVRWERLTLSEEEDIQILEVQYKPGATSGPAMSHHRGREFGLILEGELKLELGFEQYTLTPGNSIIFDSSTPHRLTNEGAQTLRAIWIIMTRSG